MGKIIAVVNHKGGVGKTATTENLGAALMKKGKKTLLVDLDGQANLTKSLGFPINMAEGTIYHAMKGLCELPIIENVDGIQFVPSCLDLSVGEAEFLNEAGRELILSQLLNKVKDKFDFILIDCPPSLALFTLNAMTVADSLLIPVQAEFLAMIGTGSILTVVNKVRSRLNPDLEIEGAVLTQYDGRKNMNESVTEMMRKNFSGYVFETLIRDNVAISEATAAGRSVLHYSPRSYGARDYIKLCDELLAKNKKERG